MPFAPENPHWSSVSALKGAGEVKGVDATALLSTSAGPLSITVGDDFVRFKIGAKASADYGLLVDVPKPAALSIENKHDGAVLSTENLRVQLEAEPLAFSVAHKDKTFVRSSTDGHFVRKHRVPPFARTNEGWIVNLELASGEAVYGLGEKWGALNRRGQLIHSVNHDALGVNAEISYKNAPVAWCSGGWGLIVHTAATVTHAVGFAQWSHRSYGIWVNDPSLDLFLVYAPTIEDFLAHYRRLLGAADVPPMWSNGVILSKAYYRDADELLATAREVRRRGMPCDTITLDGRAWQDTRTRFAFEWCPHRYPDPKPIIDELRALDLRVCVWEYPLISIENPMFDDWASKGWLLKDRRTGEAYRYDWDSEPFGAVLTPLPPSGLVDFTHPDAYAAWQGKHRDLFELGIDMIKADFGEQVTDDMVAHNGAAGPMLRNIYALLYNRCVYEAARTYGKNGAFLFSRSGWMGSHRFPFSVGRRPAG